mgnify:CR=1 FL=1
MITVRHKNILVILGYDLESKFRSGFPRFRGNDERIFLTRLAIQVIQRLLKTVGM